LSELQETKTEIQSEIAELQEVHAKESEKLDKAKERIQKQKLDLKRIDEIEAKPTLIGNKVTVDKDDFDMVITAAKKHITQEKKESALQKALDAAHKLIAELKNTVADLTRKLAVATKELAEYKSVRNKLNAANVEQENERLCNRLRTYHIKLIGYFGLLVRVQMAVGFHGSLYPFMPQAFHNQKRCAAHINQQAGVLTKTKVDVGTYLSATRTGWENRHAKPREDLQQSGMLWHGNGNFCINPQAAWI